MGDNMGYGLLYDICSTLHEREEYNFESEANCLYYIVTYTDNKVEIYEVEEYHFDGDDWGTIDVKSNKLLIDTIGCTIEDYLDAILIYARNMSQECGKEIMRYEYPYVLHGIVFRRGKIGDD